MGSINDTLFIFILFFLNNRGVANVSVDNHENVPAVPAVPAVPVVPAVPAVPAAPAVPTVQVVQAVPVVPAVNQSVHSPLPGPSGLQVNEPVAGPSGIRKPSGSSVTDFLDKLPKLDYR